MIRRSSRILLEIVIGLFAGTVILSGIVIWRVSSGPVVLDFLTPRLEAAFNQPDGEISIEVGDTVLFWAGWPKSLDLRARRIKIRDREGFTLATLPSVRVKLNLRALLQGTVAPTLIELYGARLNLVRGTDGAIQLGDSGETTPTPTERGGAESLPAVLARVMSSPGPGHPLAYLSTVRIVDAEVSINDRKLLVIWQAPSANIELRRDRAGLAGRLDLALALADRQVRIEADFHYRPADKLLAVEGQFEDLYLASLAEMMPGLEAFIGFGVPIDGRYQAELGGQAGLAGRLDLALALADRRARIGTDFLYRPAENLLAMEGQVEDLDLASLAEMIPGLEAFGGFRVPIGGRLQAELDGQAGLKSLDFDLVAGPGELALANVLATPRPVEALAFSGSFDGARNQMSLANAEVRFGGVEGPGPVLTVGGSVVHRDDGLAVEVTGALDHIETDELALYWPESAATNGRAWVLENVRGGRARDVRFDLALGLPREDPAAAVVKSASASFAYQDLAINFLRPMPPVTGVAGTADFVGSTLTFKPTGGRLEEVEVESADVKILGLDRDDQDMTMTLSLAGPLQSVLALLDHDRLKLIEPLGIAPADVTGQAAAELAFRFPLIKDLTFDDMEVSARAELADVSARDILLGQDASEGSLALELTKAGMTITGPIRLGGVPLALKWREDFTGTVDPRRTLEAEAGRVEAEERAAFRVDLRPFLDGPVSAKIVASFRRDETITIEGAANLQEAEVDFPFLKWKKTRGEEGETRFRVHLVDDQPRAVEILDLRAGTLSAQGRATLDGSDVGFSAIELDRLYYDRTQLEAVRVDRSDDGFDVVVGGGALDATVYLSGAETDDGEPVAPVKEEGEEATGPKTPLRLTASKLGVLYFAEDRYLEQVDLAMVRSTVGWEQVSMRGLVPQALRRTSQLSASSIDTSSLALDFRPDGKGKYDLKVKTNDMGSVLSALNVLDTVIGGELRMTGKSDRTALDAPIHGQIEARGYELVDAPAMASLLTVASFTGIVDLLDGEGIRFERLIGDFTYWQNVLSTDLIRAYGPALGLTAKGDVDLEEDLIDLEGTVVPAYTINQVLGAIPVLGWILVGGEGEGLLAVTYNMKGELENPRVTVNPLAALAPGFLRGLIGFTSANQGETVDTEPSLYPTNRGR